MSLLHTVVQTSCSQLNGRIFVCNDNTLELRMFLSSINATLTLLILALISASVPPCLSTILPQFDWLHAGCNYLEDFCLAFMYFIFKPTREEMVASSLLLHLFS